MKSTTSINLNLKKVRSNFVSERPSFSDKLSQNPEFRNKLDRLNSDILNTILKKQNEKLYEPFFEKDGIKLVSPNNEQFYEDFYQIPKIQGEPEKENVEFVLENTLFFSAMNVLIESPNILFSLIEITKDDRFCIVYLNQNGLWREIFLDFLFAESSEKHPEDKFSGSPKKNKRKENEKPFKYFSRLKNSENWIRIIEKAYAIAYGSYFKMLNCLIEDILYDFTGAVVETHNVKDMSTSILGDQLIKDFNKGSPMVLVKEGIKNRLRNLYDGRQTNNQWALPILDVKNTKSEYIIVKIRNLDSSFQNKLKYDKHSNEWPPDLKAELGINFDPFDILWLSLDEIKEYFSNLIICKINQENNHKKVSFNFSDFEVLSFGFCQIDLQEAFQLGITICQDDLREYKASFNYRYYLNSL